MLFLFILLQVNAVRNVAVAKKKENANLGKNRFQMEKNSLVKFIELFKSSGYRHLRKRVLENLQNFSG